MARRVIAGVGRRRAGRLPAHLAAARLTGAPPLAAALDLLAALGVDTSTAYCLSGTVESTA